jgi:hypothetical protein
MKKIIVISLLLSVLFVASALSQNLWQGHFVKRIEYKRLSQGSLRDNLGGKGTVEKLFFGDFNAPVEFSYLPSDEAACEEPPSGFRIITGASSSSHVLEVKYISNYKDACEGARKRAKEERNRLLLDIPVEVLNSLPRKTFNQIWDYNTSVSKSSYLDRYFEELPKHFRIDTLSFPVGYLFAEKLYKKMVSLIDNFKGGGVPPTIIVDGYSVSFRTVVDEEVWSLNIHMPKDDALKMVDLCKQIITDARTGKYDEPAYISVLNAF